MFVTSVLHRTISFYWRKNNQQRKIKPEHSFHYSSKRYTLPGSTRACAHSLVQLSATPWTVARQAPLSMGLSRQEHWSSVRPSGSRHLTAGPFCPAPECRGDLCAWMLSALRQSGEETCVPWMLGFRCPECLFLWMILVVW